MRCQETHPAQTQSERPDGAVTGGQNSAAIWGGGVETRTEGKNGQKASFSSSRSWIGFSGQNNLQAEKSNCYEEGEMNKRDYVLDGILFFLGRFQLPFRICAKLGDR